MEYNRLRLIIRDRRIRIIYGCAWETPIIAELHIWNMCNRPTLIPREKMTIRSITMSYHPYRRDLKFKIKITIIQNSQYYWKTKTSQLPTNIIKRINCHRFRTGLRRKEVISQAFNYHSIIKARIMLCIGTCRSRFSVPRKSHPSTWWIPHCSTTRCLIVFWRLRGISKTSIRNRLR